MFVDDIGVDDDEDDVDDELLFSDDDDVIINELDVDDGGIDPPHSFCKPIIPSLVSCLKNKKKKI